MALNCILNSTYLAKMIKYTLDMVSWKYLENSIQQTPKMYESSNIIT